MWHIVWCVVEALHQQHGWANDYDYDDDDEDSLGRSWLCCVCESFIISGKEEEGGSDAFYFYFLLFVSCGVKHSGNYYILLCMDVVYVVRNLYTGHIYVLQIGLFVHFDLQQYSLRIFCMVDKLTQKLPSIWT